jgi:hypothetical protein
MTDLLADARPKAAETAPDNAAAGAPADGGTQEVWSLGRKIGFRFLFCYVFRLTAEKLHIIRTYR